jgi:hypothetical protein
MSERAAYVTFAAAADQYAYNLYQIKESFDRHDYRSYAQLYTHLVAEVSPLYSDATLVLLISPASIGNDATKVLNTLFSAYVSVDPKSFNRKAASNALTTISPEINQFKTAARAQFNP